MVDWDARRIRLPELTPLELRRLDAQIAMKLFGWREVAINAGQAAILPPDAPDSQADDVRLGDWLWKLVPHFSDDDGLAMQVFRRMVERVGEGQISSCVENGPGIVSVTFPLARDDVGNTVVVWGLFPRAVCRAALAALDDA